jgi:hypothetical protein
MMHAEFATDRARFTIAVVRAFQKEIAIATARQMWMKTVFVTPSTIASGWSMRLGYATAIANLTLTATAFVMTMEGMIARENWMLVGFATVQD